MPKTKAPPEFPEAGQGASMTAHDFSQLIPMRDADASRGWRILYDPDDQGSASIVYVECHPDDGYSRTIYYRAGSQTVDQDTFQRHFRRRLQEVDAPPVWDDMIDRMESIEDAVAHINVSRTDAALSGEVGSRG
jgi:hypothetical protein